MPKVSVLIPAYNAEKYLEECLRSVLNQTLKDIEVIVVDDGSTDRTSEILESFLENHPFQLKVITQDNKGLYRTRARLLSLAEGDYIGWVDADDFISLEMYGTLYQLAVENNSELAFCNYQFYPEKIKTKEKWFRPYDGERSVHFVERNSMLWNKLVKRTLVDRLGIDSMLESCFDESYIKVLLEAENPVTINEELYFYRMGHSSMSSAYKDPEHYIRFIQSSKSLKMEMKYFWKDKPYWQEYFDYRVIYYTIISMLVAANAKQEQVYVSLKEDLKRQYPKYHRNIHIKKILSRNFGWVKAIAIEWFITLDYKMARLLCGLAFGE